MLFDRSLIRLAIVAGGLCTLVACGRPERAVVDQFFAASRLRDKTALQNIATVTFEPKVQGIVVKFEITRVSPEEDNTKNVVVAADVELPDGNTVQKTILLTMTRGVVKDDPDSVRRWLITGFLDASVSPAIPRL